MDANNWTRVEEFILIGFSLSPRQQILMFMLVLAAYILTVIGDLIIIFLVKMDASLHTPMYFFISNLCFLGVGYTSTTLPKMLTDLLAETKSICALCCLVQFYFFFVFGATEHLLLTVMAADRYLAICNPLRYSAVMSQELCSQLAAGCWVASSLALMVPTIGLSQLSFCGPNRIDHFFCDFSPLLKLACSDTAATEVVFRIISWSVIISCVALIVVSYIFIISTILRIPSTTGRKKAFSTCAAHFVVVLIYFGTVIFIYLRTDTSDSYYLDKVVSVFYSVVTPLLNPIIYSLRNQEVKKALKRTSEKCRSVFSSFLFQKGQSIFHKNLRT
ncbi:olfactory receptor 6N1-like [Rhinatrema bivittatum]|uniref:olfactory receptor 6N1-like n=1 Tax=Rhinatrema bivittatum TaxID=194408 RepID=UPI0011268AA5|nr:olfactory receptor 6N1-like [Rhinatrema bivittatum]